MRKRKEGNASKCGGLEEIRLSPPFLLHDSMRFRRFAGPLAVSAATLSSCFRSHAIPLSFFFSFLLRAAIFLSFRGHSFAHRASNQPRADTETPVEGAMKRSVEAGTLQILKISSPLITHVESTARFFIHPSRVPLFAS